MYYQGVGCPSGTHGSQKVTRTSIGLATSRDGITWEAERDPLLGPEALLPLDPRQSTAYTVGLIEPCVLEDATGLRMWFIYDHPSAVGNWLCLARSLDGRRWDLAPKPTLAGLDLSRFGDIRIHYPQVIPRDGRLELWFMARNVRNQVDGIFRAVSGDGGLSWENGVQILPRPEQPQILELKASVAPQLQHGGPRKLRHRVNRLLRWGWAAAGGQGRAFYGYAHPHVLESNGRWWLYFHYANSRWGQKWLDIGRCELSTEGRPNEPVLVFGPSKASKDWDHVFVGDPFVHVTDSSTAA